MLHSIGRLMQYSRITFMPKDPVSSMPAVWAAIGCDPSPALPPAGPAPGHRGKGAAPASLQTLKRHARSHQMLSACSLQTRRTLSGLQSNALSPVVVCTVCRQYESKDAQVVPHMMQFCVRCNYAYMHDTILCLIPFCVLYNV